MRDSKEFLTENLPYDFSAIANPDAAVIEVGSWILAFFFFFF